MWRAFLDFEKRFLLRVVSIGRRPEDDSDERVRKSVLAILGLMMVTGLPFEVWLANARGEPETASLMGAWAVVSLVGVIHFGITGRRRFLQTSQLAVIIAMSVASHVFTGGFERSQGIILWGSLAPLVALLLCSRREATAWFIVYMSTAAMALASGGEPLGAGTPADFAARPVAVAGLVLGFTASVFLLVWYFVNEIEKAREALALKHTELEVEQAKSEGLLLNVLPAPIAARLKDDAGIIADGHPEVTVLFADIVGFTALSTQISPKALVDLLNEVFSAFDEVADQHGVEKIKTIGDAYMAVAGLPFPHPEPIEATVRMALDMQGVVARINEGRGTALDVRIGVHAGPVVAGVIGKRKFIYDLWGDTVNIASRMESHGAPGRVHVSHMVCQALSPRWAFEARGAIPIKGRGNLETHFVVSPPGDARAPVA